MARFPHWRPGRRPLIAAAAALLLVGAVLVDPIVTAIARHRLEQRFGDVRSLTVQTPPLAWLTGAPVRAQVALGDVRIEPRQAQLGQRIDELDLTADAVSAGRLRLERVHATRRDGRIALSATVPTQTLRLGGRAVTAQPTAAADGGLTLRTDAALIPAVDLQAVGGQLVATVDGGPLDGRELPFGRRLALRIDRLDAREEGGRVTVRFAGERPKA